MSYAVRHHAAVIAVVMLAGCGGATNTVSAPGVMPQGIVPQASTHGTHGKSWMLPEAKGKDLLYVADYSGTINVYTYPQEKPVGQLIVAASTEGLCVDSSGDVFVPVTQGSDSVGYIYEYAHGGTQPIQTLTDGNVANTSCSVDPTTGNLAVTSYTDVEIFQDAKGSPIEYHIADIDSEWSAYDDSGNLFVDGEASASIALAELAKGSDTFKTVAINKPMDMESLQWNSGYLNVEGGNNRLGPVIIYHLTVSDYSATIVGSTTLNMHRHAYDGNGQYWIQGSRILGAGEKHRSLDTWRYPSGGNAIEGIKHITPWGVTVSILPSRTRVHN